MSTALEFFNYLFQKDLDFYRLVPPLFSLFLSFYLLPFYDKLFSDNLRNYLARNQQEQLHGIITGIAKDRALQIAYLSGSLSTLASIISIAKSDKPQILVGALVFVVIVGVPYFLSVFMRDPGFHATTNLPNRWYFRSLAKTRTYLAYHARVLTYLNLMAIALLLLAAPDSAI
jgi:hypothetical protein